MIKELQEPIILNNGYILKYIQLEQYTYGGEALILLDDSHEVYCVATVNIDTPYRDKMYLDINNLGDNFLDISKSLVKQGFLTPTPDFNWQSGFVTYPAYIFDKSKF